MSNELIGAELDAAVAKAIGYVLDEDGDNMSIRDNGGAPSQWHPSTDWAQGGPIIERELISMRGSNRCGWNAWMHKRGRGPIFRAETPLIAAMRVFVASKA